MTLHFFRLITNMGDTGVILPLSALLPVLLAYFETPRMAWLFLRALFCCLGLMTALKLLFLSCGGVWHLDVLSPSGHTALTVFFYGTLACVIGAHSGRLLRIATALMSIPLIVLVGISRVVLTAHTVPEVLIGAAVGAATAALFAYPYLNAPHPPVRKRWMLIVLAPVFLLTYGTVLPAEKMIRGWTPMLHFTMCGV